MSEHLVIPDTQVKPGVNTDHLSWAGQYAAEKKPDVIVHIGDHWDMPSLSSYDKGKKSFEGRRYLADVEAGNEALEKFMVPIWGEQERQRRNKQKVWQPRLIFCLGNHEYRIERAVNEDPRTEGLMSYDDLNIERLGFERKQFLEVTEVDGIAYSHYFTSGIMGRPVSNPRLLLQKKFMSSTMGHVQDRDIGFARRADGKRLTGLFAGIFYQHEEDYLGPQGNGSWSGIWYKHEVDQGQYDEMPVSLGYLKRRYG